MSSEDLTRDMKRTVGVEAARMVGQGDVVGLGNAGTFDQETSVVIDRIGNRGAAARVAEVLGIDSVASDPDPNLFVDVTVRLGAAWTMPKQPEPVTVMPAPERVGLMERLRGFLAGRRGEG